MNKSSPHYSDDKAFRIAYLISGFIRKTLTEGEHDELDQWVEASEENMRLFEELTDEAHIAANLEWMDRVQTEKALKGHLEQLSFKEEGKVKSLRNWAYAAAAACLVVVFVSIYFIARVSSNPSKEKEPLVQSDVPPGGSRATLTLSSGEVVDLEQPGKETITEGETLIQKNASGQIMYAKTNEHDRVSYNTLTTPKGGHYAVTLSDGTKVWLNAQSSLRYPVQFGDSNRVVQLEGEGYFEVTKSTGQPFIVRLSDAEEVKVLGTVFNVQAYHNETKKEVTLVEGSVRVNAQRGELLLRPGQQAVIGQGDLLLKPKVDLEAATGWKRGEFVFLDTDIYHLMRQVERWYDVDVIFRTTTSEHFNFSIARGESLSKLLRLMELTGKVHFKTENKTVYVLP